MHPSVDKKSVKLFRLDALKANGARALYTYISTRRSEAHCLRVLNIGALRAYILCTRSLAKHFGETTWRKRQESQLGVYRNINDRDDERQGVFTHTIHLIKTSLGNFIVFL